MQALQERRVTEVRQLPDLFGLLQMYFAANAVTIERIISMNRETEAAQQSIIEQYETNRQTIEQIDQQLRGRIEQLDSNRPRIQKLQQELESLRSQE
jgi:DNA repair exonuclease SbcCD ATPase subunit